jgi:hypothetical protein
MNYSRTVRDGSARDEALKRRNGAVREGMGQAFDIANENGETERETLDREIYALDRIMRDDAAALRSVRTSVGDRMLLKLQIGIRKAMTAGLMRRRGKLPPVQ